MEGRFLEVAQFGFVRADLTRWRGLQLRRGRRVRGVRLVSSRAGGGSSAGSVAASAVAWGESRRVEASRVVLEMEVATAARMAAVGAAVDSEYVACSETDALRSAAAAMQMEGRRRRLAGKREALDTVEQRRNVPPRVRQCVRGGSSVMAGGGTHEHGLSGGDALALTRAAGRGRGVKRSKRFSRESSRDDR